MARKIPALILARGGSKGIPGKNLKQVNGTSIVLRTARAAQRSSLDPVFVWSDSRDIAAVCEQMAGATAPIRPESTATDEASTESSVQSFLSQHDPAKKFDAICVLQCTTPFLRREHIDRAVKLYESGGLDSVVSAVRFDRYLGYSSEWKNSKFVPMRPYRARRQDGSPPFWMENGGIYLATRKLWESGRRIGSSCGVVEMGWWESLEIDEPLDLDVAESIAHLVGG